MAKPTPLEISKVFDVLARRIRESARVGKALRKLRPALARKKFFLGYAVGTKKRRGKKMPGLAALLFVRRKVPQSALRPADRLPPYILVGGKRVPTDVVRLPPFKSRGRQFNKYRPVEMGCSIIPCPPHQPPVGTGYGSAGAVVVDSGTGTQHSILTAGHVLEEDGQDVIQPFWGKNRDDPATLPPGKAPQAHDNIGGNTILAGGGVDAGIFEANSGVDTVIGVGAPTGIIPPMVGLPVVKSGATTEVSAGWVNWDQMTVSAEACPDTPKTVFQFPRPPTGPPLPDAQFLEGVFSVQEILNAGGDSGCLIMAGPEKDLVEFVESLAPGYPRQKYSNDLSKTVAGMLLNNAVGLLIRGAGTSVLGVNMVTATSALDVQLDGIMPSAFNAKLIRAMKG